MSTERESATGLTRPGHDEELTEERLAAAQDNVAKLTNQNEKLAATLRQARDQIVTIKEEIDRLAAPPSGFGVFLQLHDDGTVDVFTGGRKLRVTVSPSVEAGELQRGQEVMLNEALNVVAAMGFERAGEVVMLKELLYPENAVAATKPDRALVISRADEERVVHLADT
ncbi:MAG: proteasome ATPase, partial [Mycobacteriales bacterium]